MCEAPGAPTAHSPSSVAQRLVADARLQFIVSVPAGSPYAVLWRLPSLDKLGDLRGYHVAPLSALALCRVRPRRGNALVTAGLDGAIVFWDMDQKAPLSHPTTAGEHMVRMRGSPSPPPSQADLLPCWTLVLPQQRKPRARPRFLHGGAVSGSRPPPQGFGPTRVALLPHGPRWATQWPIHRPCLTRWHGASPPQVWDVAELKQRGKLTGHRAPVVGARIEQGFVLTADRRGVVCVHLEGELAPSLFHRPWRKREASSLRRPFL